MSAPLRKPPVPITNGGGSHLQEFAAELGSPDGLDPIPPAQYLNYQDARYGLNTRLWAAVLARTIRRGIRRAVAQLTEEDAKFLKRPGAAGSVATLDDLAQLLEVDPANLGRAWRDHKKEGRLQKAGRGLRLVGNFKLPPLREDYQHEEGDEWANKGRTKKVCTDLEEKAKGKVCPDLLKPYIRNQLSKLPAKVAAKASAEYTAEWEIESDLLATLQATGRAFCMPRKDNTLTPYGVKVQRLERVPDPIRDALLAEMSPLLERLAEHIKRTNDEEKGSVQTFASGGEETAQRGSVQTSKKGQYGPSILIDLENSNRENNNNSGGASDEVVVVAEKLGIAPKAAATFLASCRAQTPAATVAEILEAAEAVARSIAPGKVNPTGIVLRGTPDKLVVMARTRPRGKPEPTREQQMQACRDWIADPEASEAEKAHYRAMLRGYENGHAT